MATIISIALQKGGTGKTTTSQALASTLGFKGYKVLLLDMDSQANVTAASGVSIEHTVTDVLAGECSLIEAITSTSLYDLIGADSFLSNLESIEDLDSTLLKNLLAAVYDIYDFIVIDTPPLLGNILKNCLMASHWVIIPTDPRPFSLNGLDRLQETIESVKRSNTALNVLGILLVKYSDRSVLNRQLRGLLDDKALLLGTTVFCSKIREGIAVAEAQTMGQSLIEYAPKSKPCIDYIEFTNEVITRLEKN